MSPDLAAWLERLEQRHPQSIDLGLERCGAVWQRMGAPRPGRQVITVAGTNGKGSAVAWLASILSSLGHSTCSYTSPHIVDFNERLLLGAEAVGDTRLVAAFKAVEAARVDISLTYFEFTTLACLGIMAAEQSDVAILEVGLGGRLDTVNLVDADVAVIMPIGLDHQQYLGHDIDAIAREKAGILRPGQTVVCADPAVPGVVLERAAKLDCRVLLAGRDFAIQPFGQGLCFVMQDQTLDLPILPLAGAHQPHNLAAALAAISVLQPGLLSCWQQVRQGVARVRLTGRLEQSAVDPGVWLDVGHNPQAASAVADWMRTHEATRWHIVLGMLADKDVSATVTLLAEHAPDWYCAGLQGSRGQTGVQLSERLLEALPGACTRGFNSVGEALEAARQNCQPGEAVLVFGSFETVSQALGALSQQHFSNNK